MRHINLSSSILKLFLRRIHFIIIKQTEKTMWLWRRQRNTVLQTGTDTEVQNHTGNLFI